MIKAIEFGATLLGLTLRGLWLIVSALPQIAGLMLIGYGAWLFDERLGYVLLGFFLLVVSAPKTKPKDRRGA